MDCAESPFDFLHESFPEVDARVIKATVLEHGDDIESAITFLVSITDEANHAFSVSEGSAVNEEGEITKACDCTESPNTTADVVSSSRLDDGTSKRLHAFDEEPSYHQSYESLQGSVTHISMESFLEMVQQTTHDKEEVLNIINEVSSLRAKADQESNAAERAKREATTSGHSLLKKADDLRKQIAQRKQENLTRIGDIYGEKVVLATEARELKLRLKQVKSQKEQALRTLNEIRVTLQGYYDAAAEERMMAEEEARVKEEEARKVLAVEEAELAVVEHEARKLDEEAEACVQLKEFLSEQGTMVDALQGEISVLCEDTELFKRQVEDGMWSSVSMASLSSSGVNPEGPYTFRRRSVPIVASQDLGRDSAGLHNGAVRWSQNSSAVTASSKDMMGSFGGGWASSQSSVEMVSHDNNEEVPSYRQVATECSFDTVDDTCHHGSTIESHLEEDDATAFHHGSAIESSFCTTSGNNVDDGTACVLHDSIGMGTSLLELDWTAHVIRNNWTANPGPAPAPAPPVLYDTEKMVDSDYGPPTEHVQNGWVFTTQVSDGSNVSYSSSSSSMINIEAEDYF